jgi:hypothetical protein
VSEEFDQTYRSVRGHCRYCKRRTSVQKDTGRSGIQDTANDARFGAITVIRLSNAKTDGDTDRCTDRVEDGGYVSGIIPFSGKVESRQSRS